MKQTILLFAVAALFSGAAVGQCRVVERNQKKPAWVGGEYKKEVFKLFDVRDNSLDAARRKIENEVAQRQSIASGRRFDISSNNSQSNVSSSDNLTVQGDYLDEYYELCAGGEARVCRLYQIEGEHPGPNTKLVRWKYDDEYSVNVLPLIPFAGAAQFYKGHSGRGAVFMIAQIGLVGGGIVMMMNANDAYDKSVRAIDLKEKNTEYSNYESAQQVATGLFIGAGIAYLGQIVEGYVTTPSRKRFRIAALPTTFYNNSKLQGGVAINITF